MRVPTDKEIVSDAKVVAAYWKALVVEGVEPQQAAYMALMMVAALKGETKPKEPWET